MGRSGNQRAYFSWSIHCHLETYLPPQADSKKMSEIHLNLLHHIQHILDPGFHAVTGWIFRSITASMAEGIDQHQPEITFQQLDEAGHVPAFMIQDEGRMKDQPGPPFSGEAVMDAMFVGDHERHNFRRFGCCVPIPSLLFHVFPCPVFPAHRVDAAIGDESRPIVWVHVQSFFRDAG